MLTNCIYWPCRVEGLFSPHPIINSIFWFLSPAPHLHSSWILLASLIIGVVGWIFCLAIAWGLVLCCVILPAQVSEEEKRDREWLGLSTASVVCMVWYYAMKRVVLPCCGHLARPAPQLCMRELSPLCVLLHEQCQLLWLICDTQLPVVGLEHSLWPQEALQL